MPRAEVVIRRLASADACALVALARAALPSWSDDALAAELSREGSGVWGALEGDRLVAFAVVRWVAGEAELMLIAVDAAERRRGWASRLWSEIRAAMAAMGVERVFLEVRASNAGARAFYSARGFTEIALRRGYYQHPPEDAVVLSHETTRG